MDALDLLANDHNRLRGLAARFRGACDRGDDAVMRSAADAVLHELDVHTRAEEEVFYPVVRDWGPSVEALVAAGVEEHHVAKVLATRIPQLTPGTDEWRAALERLVEAVEQHAGLEERELFPLVRDMAEPAVREGLGERIDRRRQALGAAPAGTTIDLTAAEVPAATAGGDMVGGEPQRPSRRPISR